jgi:hypothetical protein
VASWIETFSDSETPSRKAHLGTEHSFAFRTIQLKLGGQHCFRLSQERNTDHCARMGSCWRGE